MNPSHKSSLGRRSFSSDIKPPLEFMALAPEDIQAIKIIYEVRHSEIKTLHICPPKIADRSRVNQPLRSSTRRNFPACESAASQAIHIRWLVSSSTLTCAPNAGLLPHASSTDTVRSYYRIGEKTLLAYRRESQMSPAATLRNTTPAGSPIHGFLFKTRREAEIDVTL